MKVENHSRCRLQNDPFPEDLAYLVTHFHELLAEFEVTFNGEEDWEPWADKSYLTEDDLADPDIAANVKAIDDTYALISFVAEFPDGEYVGCWRGVERRPVNYCPLVYYTNNAQFILCGSNFIEVLFWCFDEVEELKPVWIYADCLGTKPMFDLEDRLAGITPEEYHLIRYKEYRKGN